MRRHMPFVESLPGKMEELHSALLRHRRGDGRALISARAVAIRLYETADELGFDELASAARAAWLAAPPQLEASVNQLVKQIEATHAVARRRRSRIVVFASSPTTATYAREALAATGADVRCVSSRKVAEDVIAEQRPDVVVVDLAPPDADARALLRRYDASRDASPPIIALVPRKNPAVLRECIEAGVAHAIDTPPDLELLKASVDAVVRRRADQLRRLREDSLTGLLNRAGILDALKRAQGLASRTHLRCAVAMIDIDHFKDVNDRFGHAMGDRVLRGFGLLLRSALRAGDVVGRWGGEEFLVLMPNTSAASGVVALEHVGEAFHKLTFGTSGGRVDKLTFSAGVVDFDDAVDVDEVVAAADELLYAAKSNGRNLVLDGAPSSTQSVQRALVVEDDEDQSALLAKLLEAEGLTPIVASNSDEAMRALQEHDVHVVLLDWMLGDEYGAELLQRIRGMPRFARLPIVTVTARADERTLERTFELGGDDFVQKPLRPRELIARVRRLLSRSQPPAGLPRPDARTTIPPRSSWPDASGAR